MTFIKNIFIMVIILISFYSNSISAKAYKCTINGKISYQSSPCINADKKEEINIKVNKISPEQSCLSTCSSEELICISKLDDAGFNSDGGLKVCSLKKDWCEGICKKEKNIELIDKKYAYISAKNNYKYKIAINKIDANAKKRKKQRISDWYLKREKEISDCITKGMVEIDSLKMRSVAWEREKILKVNCEKKARSKIYGVY